jgi:MFS family permease
MLCFFANSELNLSLMGDILQRNNEGKRFQRKIMSNGSAARPPPEAVRGTLQRSIFLQERLGASVETLAWAYFPSALVWTLLPSRLGTLADRFGRKPLMVLGLVAAAAGSFFLPFLSSILAFAVLWAVLALCFATGEPAEQALVADLTGYDRRGRAYGFYAMANDLGATIGPFGGAWLYQHVGASAPFCANSLLLALCALLLVFFLHLPLSPAGQIAGDMPV